MDYKIQRTWLELEYLRSKRSDGANKVSQTFQDKKQSWCKISFMVFQVIFIFNEIFGFECIFSYKNSFHMNNKKRNSPCSDKTVTYKTLEILLN